MNNLRSSGSPGILSSLIDAKANLISTDGIYFDPPKSYVNIGQPPLPKAVYFSINN